MRGRNERSRVEQLEDQLIRTRIMARRLWNALKARSGLEEAALFDDEELRVADRVYDAAQTVWERHRISILPCRTILDPAGASSFLHGWPTQGEVYLGCWPDGTTRNLTRAQVLMMGGQDVEEEPRRVSDVPDEDVPF